MKRREFSIFLLSFSGTGAWPMAKGDADFETMEHVSAKPFAATLDRLISLIEAAGMRIFARIDHAAGAREAGLELLPTTVLIYGHAKGGTAIINAAPLAALDLPLRVLIREDSDGRVWMAFHPIAPLLRALGVPEELATRLQPAQRVLLEAIKP